ncbi:mechanosensitive ion channel domain-containing protein [Ferrimonas balearica]|uniref:mechanosensitive ion channel domain-containing protein n=1 Tax=Ferrimonas balearica TaxID=44012 RepID=UPI001C99095F|nr:mechanosensitive ion channel domain-containing protein [Ferrimonas balearica]MBY5923070.1 mechanosensitive ion channel [Ferrimonas balearica]MBY5997554.1 mechanosensitive ion channel [Ferrimonas balearica]
MRRLLLPLLLLLVAVSVQANAPFSLERRLSPFGKQENTQTTAEQWQVQRQQLEKEQAQYQNLITEFPVRQAELQSQLNRTLSSEVDPSQGLAQQLSLVHLELQELKASTSSLAEMRKEMRQRIASLPQLEQQANVQLRLASSGSEAIRQARQGYFSQLLKTVQTEQKALPLQLQLIQLRERLVHNQQVALEQRLANLNDAIATERRAQSRSAITTTLPRAGSDPSLSQMSEENAELARALARINGRLEQLGNQTVQAEQAYQQLSTHLSETQEQLQWGGGSAAFGEALIRQLKRLEKPTADSASSRQLSQSRLDRYDYEQHRESLLRQLRSIPKEDPTRELLDRQLSLLEQLIDAHEQLVLDLTRLKLQQEQLALQSERFRKLINEHLFWLPNNRPLDRNWTGELALSISWLVDAQRIAELRSAVRFNSTGWSLWLVLVVAVVVLSDLLKGPYARLQGQQARYIGNVTLDRFSASVASLFTATAFSLLAPLPLWAAGALLYSSEGHLFAQALGKALLFVAVPIQLYWTIHQLSRPDGLMIAHFRRYPPLVSHVLRFLRKSLWVATPLILLVVMTDALDLEMIKASLGRGAFLVLCLVLAYFYRRISKFAGQYHLHHSRGHNGRRRLLEKLIWLALIIVPLVALFLAARGYYYSAQQLLSQAQLTVVLALLYLLGYLMVKRWTLIERRRLQFERAKAKRAEALAQREREKAEGIPASSAEGMLESGDDPLIDLDTISTQSLSLMRSLMVLAFFLSLIALWSQTHSAMFSFLEGITLWSSTQMVDGVEQAVPITLMSFATAVMVAVFTAMIARNLPGLLELALLQRLELSPGTGFAITSVSKYVIYTVGVFVTFSMLGLAWNKLQWLIAALTFGLAFGLQEIFANFISGIIILFEKPIRIGDTVTIRELTGTVSKIQIRATTIVDWDRKEIIVPNKAFITEQLVNWSLSDPITRITMKISVARDSDPALVEALLHQAVKECPLALENPEPEIYFGGFGSHTQDFEMRAYADEMGKRWPLRHDLHMRILSKFREAGVVLAYPQMDLHIRSGDAKESGLIR